MHVEKQSERMSKSLLAMGCGNRAKLFVAAYYWQDDEDCLSFTRSQGYGIIQPNGLHLTVDVMAEGEQYSVCTYLREPLTKQSQKNCCRSVSRQVFRAAKLYWFFEGEESFSDRTRTWSKFIFRLSEKLEKSDRTKLRHHNFVLCWYLLEARNQFVCASSFVLLLHFMDLFGYAPVIPVPLGSFSDSFRPRQTQSNLKLEDPTPTDSDSALI